MQLRQRIPLIGDHAIESRDDGRVSPFHQESLGNASGPPIFMT